MKIDVYKIRIAMANACMDIKDLQKYSGVPAGTISNIFNRKSLRPSTVGKIAKALNVSVKDILADEKELNYQNELDSKVKMIVRYTELAVRLSEYSMKNREWKPEYTQEMEAIKTELLQLRADLGLDEPDKNAKQMG